MKKIIILAICLVSFGLQAETNNVWFPWTLSIQGSGGTSLKQDNSSFATSFGLTRNDVLPHVDFGVRQSIGFADLLSGGTALAQDYNIKLLPWLKVYGGVSEGAAYKEKLPTTWFVGPEVGLKLYVHKDVYINGRVNYDFQLSDSSKDALRYTIGISIPFGSGTTPKGILTLFR